MISVGEPEDEDPVAVPRLQPRKVAEQGGELVDPDVALLIRHRVTIHMAELPITMLACARLGVITPSMDKMKPGSP